MYELVDDYFLYFSHSHNNKKQNAIGWILIQ